jgi:hypothetical protein
MTREHNFKRYRASDVMSRMLREGNSRPSVLANLLPTSGFLFGGAKPTSTDAGTYGFIANIYFYEIDMPLKEFLASQTNVVLHCQTCGALHHMRAVPAPGTRIGVSVGLVSLAF